VELNVMDDQARAIGQRVRYWRQRRNIDRQRFADMVGRSVSWLDKVERGDRNLLRLPMLEQVAKALGVVPAVLVDSPAAQRAADCVDAVEVQAIRSALGRYPSLSGRPAQAPPTAAGVVGQLAYVGQAWLSSHFTTVARHLPKLIGDAQLAVAAAPRSYELEAQRALVVTYRLASSMLLKFDARDIAWLAADRAMQTALATDDTVALARATRSVARAMTSAGQRADALRALIGMTDRMRPELPIHEYELLSLGGMLFLAASIAAAGQDDNQLALLMHQEAEALSRRVVPQHQLHNTVFGRANVAVHRVAALVRLHEAGRALEYATSIDPNSIAALPPERRANYLLDLTNAYAHTRQYKRAVRTLGEAERVAPEEVRCRPLAHGLLRSLLSHTSGEGGRLVQQMAARAGVTG
jgi:transcriptional regulator with XRE-family HTH domain